MRRLVAALFLLCALCGAQKPAPIPDSSVEQRKEVFKNARVTVTRVDFAPGESIPMHQHSRDMIAVFATDGSARETLLGGKAKTEKIAAGEVRYHRQGYAHATSNLGSVPFRVELIEFADPQGAFEHGKPKKSHYCNPGSATACVDEHSLFCTAKVCVEDVTIAPGAVTTRHSHSTDHMLVAVSDYEFTDQIEGKGKVVRTRKSGEAEYIPAGITHQLTNTGKAAARFIVVVWR
ncbi:MAG TPA: cupin domain-containing protein [Terriglobales bacterium]|jgi:quercetin dioxygenase-like cupin family protein|nr:cupin domain-containing protein [Terriglobales bacterium]